MEIKKISDKNIVTRIGDVRLYIKQDEYGNFAKLASSGIDMAKDKFITMPKLKKDIDYKSMGLFTFIAYKFNTRVKNVNGSIFYEYFINVNAIAEDMKTFGLKARKETIESNLKKMLKQLAQCKEIVDFNKTSSSIRLTIKTKKYFSINEDSIEKCLTATSSDIKKISKLGILAEIAKYSVFENKNNEYLNKSICLVKQKDLCEYSSISTKQWKTLFDEIVKDGLLCFVKTYSPVYGTLKYYIADACSFDYLVWYLSYGKVAITSNIYIREYYLNGVHFIDEKEDYDYYDVQEVA